jgi:hypothetical protein
MTATEERPASFAELPSHLAAGLRRSLTSTGTSLVFYAPDGTSREQLEVLATATGMQQTLYQEYAEEDGWPWHQVTGFIGDLDITIAADASALLLDPLTGRGVISRTYVPAAGEATP